MPDLPRPSPPKHLLPLDGLRGIAILLVVFYHLFQSESTFNWPGRLATIITHAVSAGWIGVDLFFVLSGFLITGVLLDAKADPHFFRNFYMRRTLRIFPLYYAALAFALLIAPPLFRHLGYSFEPMHNNPAWFWLYGTNILMSLNHNWETTAPLSCTHFWSLAVEEHFYLLWPLVVYRFSLRTLAKIALAVIVAVTLARAIYVLRTHDFVAAYVLTPFRIDTLLAGAFAAILMRSPRGRAAARRFAPPLAALGLLLFLAIYHFIHWNQQIPNIAIVGFPVLTLLFTATLLACLNSNPARLPNQILSHPTLRFFGRYSYGLYVYHIFVIQIFNTDTLEAWLCFHLRSFTVGIFAEKLVLFAIATLIAVTSYHLFEVHFLKLKRYFH